MYILYVDICMCYANILNILIYDRVHMYMTGIGHVYVGI